MFIDRADILMKLPKEVLNFDQSYKEVFETIRSLIGKGDDPEEFLLRLRILQYFEEGHYEQRYHTKRQVAEALDIDDIHLKEAFADFQHHEILVPNSGGNAYRLHNKAGMYLMYLKGFFIEQTALASPKEQFIRLQELAKAMRIQDSSRRLFYRVYFDALDNIRELNEKTQTKAVIRLKEELIDFFLELQPQVNEKLIEDFGPYRANLFFINYIALDSISAILTSEIETAKRSSSSSIKRNLDPIIVEEFIKRVPSDLILALTQFYHEPIGIPSANEQEAVDTYFRIFQEISEKIEYEELPPPRSEELIFFSGIELPQAPPDIEELAMTYFNKIENCLPASLLFLISASNFEETLSRWHFLAILAKRNMISFESGTTRKSDVDNGAFFEDVEVLPLSN